MAVIALDGSPWASVVSTVHPAFCAAFVTPWTNCTVDKSVEVISTTPSVFCVGCELATAPGAITPQTDAAITSTPNSAAFTLILTPLPFLSGQTAV